MSRNHSKFNSLSSFVDPSDRIGNPETVVTAVNDYSGSQSGGSGGSGNTLQSAYLNGQSIDTTLEGAITILGTGGGTGTVLQVDNLSIDNSGKISTEQIDITGVTNKSSIVYSGTGDKVFDLNQVDTDITDLQGKTLQYFYDNGAFIDTTINGAVQLSSTVPSNLLECSKLSIDHDGKLSTDKIDLIDIDNFGGTANVLYTGAGETVDLKNVNNNTALINSLQGQVTSNDLEIIALQDKTQNQTAFPDIQSGARTEFNQRIVVNSTNPSYIPQLSFKKDPGVLPIDNERLNRIIFSSPSTNADISTWATEDHTSVAKGTKLLIQTNRNGETAPYGCAEFKEGAVYTETLKVVAPNNSTVALTNTGTLDKIIDVNNIATGTDVSDLEQKTQHQTATLTDTTFVNDLKIPSGDVYIKTHKTTPITIDKGNSNNVLQGDNTTHINITGTANNNVSYGTFALDGITSGSGNTAIGDSALQTMSTGGGNIAIGDQCCFSATTGNEAVFIGQAVANTMINSGKNVAIGYGAMSNCANTGADMKATCIGYQAGINMTGGTLNNVCIGNSSKVTNANYGLALGSATNVLGNYGIALGHGSSPGANEMRIGGGSNITKITPSHAGCDLGQNATGRKFKDLWLVGNANIDGTVQTGSANVTGTVQTSQVNVFAPSVPEILIRDTDTSDINGFLAQIAFQNSSGTDASRIVYSNGKLTLENSGNGNIELDTANSIVPAVTSTNDLGTNVLKFKDLWLGGNANITGTLNAETATINTFVVTPSIKDTTQTTSIDLSDVATNVFSENRIQLQQQTITGDSATVDLNGGTIELTRSSPGGGGGGGPGTKHPLVVATSNTGVWGIIASSSFQSPTSNSPWNAFDGNSTTFWNGGVNQYNGTTGVYSANLHFTNGYAGDWLQIQLGTVPSNGIGYYRLTPLFIGSDPSPQTPVNFKVFSSTNGTTWVERDSRVGVVWQPIGTEPNGKLFTLVSTSTDIYWRIVANKVGNEGTTGRQLFQVQELAYFEEVPPLPSTQCSLLMGGGQVDVTGDLAVSGNIIKSYGFISANGNALATSITTVGTYAPVLITSGIVSTILNDFTYTGPGNSPRLTYTNPTPKVFSVNVSVSGAMVTNGASIIQYVLFKNGVEYTQSCAKVLMDGNDLDPNNVNIACLIALEQADYVNLYVRNLTSTDSIVVECYSLVITQV